MGGAVCMYCSTPSLLLNGSNVTELCFPSSRPTVAIASAEEEMGVEDDVVAAVVAVDE